MPSKITGALLLAAQLLCLTLAFPASSAASAPVSADGLYEAQTIVTGQGEENRTRALAKCLEDVLVKVSGDPRLIDHPSFAALADKAAELVVGFEYRDRLAGIPVHDEQGTRDRPYDLLVSFDPARINVALRTLGLRPWSATRPRVVMFIEVSNGATNYALTSDGVRGRDMRDSLLAASAQFGISIVLPSSATMADIGTSCAAMRTGEASCLSSAVKASGGDVALPGTVVWDEDALGWVAEWRLAFGDDTYQWGVRGVGFDAAFRRALAGAAQVLSGHGRPD